MDVFTYAPEVILAGGKPYRLLNHSFLFGSDLSRGVKFDALLSDRTLATIKAGEGNVIANIEPDPSIGADWAFYGYGSNNSADPKCQRIVIDILTRIREMDPDCQLGIYAMTPIRERQSPVKFWASARYGRYSETLQSLIDWQAQSVANLEWLEPFVDFFAPSLYDVVPGGDAAWAQFAMSNLDQIRHYSDLPIRPFMSNVCQGKLVRTKLSSKERLSGRGAKSQWQNQLDFARMCHDEEIIDGVYLWGNLGWPEDHVHMLSKTLELGKSPLTTFKA